MADGPFVPGIMPVKSEVHFNDVTAKWVVKVSRQVDIVHGGSKREVSRQSFDTYDQALTFISVFWGNS